LNDPELDLAEILKELDDIGPLPSPDASLIQEQKKPKPEKNIIEIPPSTFKREVQTVRPIVPEVKLSESDDISVAEELTPQLKAVIGRAGEIFNEIIKNYRGDREQAQSAIEHFLSIIEMGGKIPRVYVEKLPDVIRAKNEIGMNAIKAFEAIPKFLASIKNNEILVANIQQNNTAMPDLEKLLEISKYDDEL